MFVIVISVTVSDLWMKSKSFGAAVPVLPSDHMCARTRNTGVNVWQPWHSDSVHHVFNSGDSFHPPESSVCLYKEPGHRITDLPNKREEIISLLILSLPQWFRSLLWKTVCILQFHIPSNFMFGFMCTRIWLLYKHLNNNVASACNLQDALVSVCWQIMSKQRFFFNVKWLTLSLDLQTQTNAWIWFRLHVCVDESFLKPCHS